MGSKTGMEVTSIVMEILMKAIGWTTKNRAKVDIGMQYRKMNMMESGWTMLSMGKAIIGMPMGIGFKVCFREGIRKAMVNSSGLLEKSMKAVGGRI